MNIKPHCQQIYAIMQQYFFERRVNHIHYMTNIDNIIARSGLSKKEFYALLKQYENDKL